MTLVRWTPDPELTTGYAPLLQRPYTPFGSPMFTHHPITSIGQPYWATIPPVDLIDQQHEFVVKAEVPGVDPGNLKIMVADNVLTIRGERLPERELKTDNYFWAERSTGAFQRSITLPVPVEPAEVNAYCDNGILTVRLPKSREALSVEIGVQGTTGSGRQTAIRGGGGGGSQSKSGGRGGMRRTKRRSE